MEYNLQRYQILLLHPRNKYCKPTTLQKNTLDICKELDAYVNPKEMNTEYSLEGLMLKLQYFGLLIRRTDSLEKILMLEKTEGKRRQRTR